MWSNRCDLCSWPTFRKVNQLFSDMQDVIRFSLLSVPWHMIWLVEGASQWADRFLDPICFFFGKIHWTVALWEGFLKRICVAVFLWLQNCYVFKGNFWLQILLQIVSRFWMFIMSLQIHYPPGNCNITYPTLGKGTSSSTWSQVQKVMIQDKHCLCSQEVLGRWLGGSKHFGRIFYCSTTS